VVRFTVRLTPRGGADRIDGVRDGELQARVSAAPVEGAANESLLRLIARELEVPPGAVRVVSGAHARRKVVSVRTDRERVMVRWPDLRV